MQRFAARAGSRPPPARPRRGPWLRRAELVLLALSSALGGCSARGQPPREPRSDAEHFTLASFNLDFPMAGDADTLEAIGKTGADVVFLQEVSPSWEALLRRRYAQSYPHALFAAAGGAGGLGVLSRYPLRSERSLPAVFRHPAWLIRVAAPGSDLLVLNVHLRSSTRRGQSLLPGLLSMASDHESEIRSFVEACPTQPDLVVGDFNEGPSGSAVTWLTQRNFVDALSRYRPGQATWRALPLAGIYRSTLDHILFRGCVDALDATILHEGNSDHWPVLARLEIDRGSGCSQPESTSRPGPLR